MVEVGDPEGPQGDDQRRVLLVLGDGGVVSVVLGVVGAAVDRLARLPPEEARDAGRQERVVVAAAARGGRRPRGSRTASSRRAR